MAVCHNWLRYLEHCPLPGGCLITPASVEWDGLAGAIHEAVVAAQRRWLELLSAEADVGIRAGEFPHHLDAGQLAFELNGIAMSLNQAIQTVQ